MRRTASVLALAGLTLAGACAPALARPQYQSQFYFVYNTKRRSNIQRASCSLCHVDRRGGQLNRYGRALKKAGHYEKYEYKGYRAIEGLDSDGDHWTNGEEIAKDKLPGDRASHPKKPKKKKEKPKGEKHKKLKGKKPRAEKKGGAGESPKAEDEQPKGDEPKSKDDKPGDTHKDTEENGDAGG